MTETSAVPCHGERDGKVGIPADEVQCFLSVLRNRWSYQPSMRSKTTALSSVGKADW